MNYIDSLLNENNNSTTNSNSISLPEADPLLKQMQEDAEQRYYNQLSGSTYSSEPKRLSLDEIAAKKEARLAKKRDELIEDDSNFTLKAKSLYNTVNNLWDGEDLKANYMGKEHGMSNKIFEDVDATMEESQIKRQELIDQYNMAEGDQNARHKVYQLRLKEGYDQNGNPVRNTATVVTQLDEEPVVLPDGTVKVYNAVSPNDDGKNDFFRIEGIELYPENTVEIYNRWGVLVYERKGYNNLDKTFKGMSEGRVTVNQSEQLPTGTYYYVLKYIDGKGVGHEKAGYLYINR